MAEWLGRGLQNLLHGFDSRRCLQIDGPLWSCWATRRRRAPSVTVQRTAPSVAKKQRLLLFRFDSRRCLHSSPRLRMARHDKTLNGCPPSTLRKEGRLMSNQGSNCTSNQARVVELVYTADLKSVPYGMRVRLPPRAPH